MLDLLDPGSEKGSGIIVGAYSLRSDDGRFTRLFFDAVRRPPALYRRITTLKSVSFERGRTVTTVGLTRCTPSDGGSGSSPKQSIAFYSLLVDELTDQAAMAVIAHELAHAWLNEHVRPEESSEREREADELARAWGFGPELDSLDSEAETVGIQ